MNGKPTPVIYWFRQDLRLDDLPALHAAADSGRPVLACFVIDEDTPGRWAPGEASCWWLHHSLESLAGELGKLGGELLVRRGHTVDVLAELVAETSASAVYCSQAYEPWARRLEQQLASSLGAAFHCLPGSLLLHPDEIRTRTGGPFRVFTPFWRAGLAQLQHRSPLPTPAPGVFLERVPAGLAPDDWGLLPGVKSWSAHWPELWSPGEAGAAAALEAFVAEGLHDYSEGRDFPARRRTSRLSPHLHWGELSPWQVLRALERENARGEDQNRDKFRAELGWREFNHHLLYHYPQICDRPLKADFSAFPWSGDRSDYQAWQQGLTGYPLVDAGMRELWHTGFMHNRVRMVAASFLCKHLLLPWQWGARWFWDTLVDADLANNSGGWQWVAGCGADASPWFRIFNPVAQGKKFDPQGQYLRQWVPELASLPDRYLHAPWEAPAALLKTAGVVLGETYPQPIIDHRFARQRALQAYQERTSARPSASLAG